MSAPAATVPQTLVRDLARIVGEDGVIADPARLIVYESDGLTAYRSRPRAAVFPRDAQEVAAVLRCLGAAGVPFVPRGSGTGLSGGALAGPDAVLVATTRMTRILEIDAPNRRAVVQPGVVNVRLSQAARPYGLYYAPDPSSQPACSIGGNVAENSGGPHCLKYGVTSRYVTGLTVVLPDGEVVRLGGMSGEARGYDLVGLFVGSEGTFGIATEIEVGLLPLPEAVETLLAIFDDLEVAGRAVTEIIAAGLLPAALEMIDRATIRAVEASVFAAGYPTDAAAALVVEFDGLRAGLDRDAERAAAICQRTGAREVRRAADDREREALWRGRKKAFGAMGRISPDLLVQDATVPRTKLPEVLRRISEIAERYGLTVANVFHAGDGNLHPNILFDRRDEEQVRRVEAASKQMMAVCVEAGGTITGEHGVGLDKRQYLPLIYGPDVIETMRAVRAVFDPRGMCNPGKILLPAGEGATAARDAGDARTSGSATAVPAGEGPGTRDTLQPDRLVAELSRFLPRGCVLSGPDAARWSAGGVIPKAVVTPERVEQVAELLARACAEGWAVLPAGNGTWVDAGNPPARADIVLSVAQLAAIEAHEPADLVITAGAGLTLRALDAACRQHGQWLPLDPPADRSESGTIGATLATASAGPLASFYGTPRDHVLGLTLVTGDGRVLVLGARVVKNVAGYDLVKLAVGSWGTLGVITSATFRLTPVPERDATLIFRDTDPALLLGVGRSILEKPLDAHAAVLLSPSAGRTLRKGAAEADPQTWVLALRLHGNAESVDEAARRIEAAAGRRPAAHFDGGDSQSLWTGLSGLEFGSRLVVRLTALPSRVAVTLDLVRRLASDAASHVAGEASRPGARSPVLVADLPAGTVRLVVADGVSAEAGYGDWARALTAARQTIERDGGTLTLSHAPPRLAREVGTWGDAGTAVRVMRELKARFDPAGILNPGRFVV